jgi:glycosyltransferase involved in cell wall biosynthesis
MLTFVLGGIGPTLSIGRCWAPDVACAFFGVPTGLLTVALKRAVGIPYLVSLRGGDVPGAYGQELARMHRLAAPLIRAVWRSSSGLIANSQGLADVARRTWPDAPISVIPNGIDVESFSSRPRSRPGSPVRVLYVGRLSPEKGVKHLVEAMPRAGAAVVLRLVGDGPDRPMLQAVASKLGIADRVEFTGWAPRTALPEHYAWADLFAMPSLGEGMPNAILEAQAAGLAVVTTDACGNRDLVKTGHNGLLVPPADAAALGSAIALLAGDPRLLRDMGGRGREDARGYRWERVAVQYYEHLAVATRHRAARRSPHPVAEGQLADSEHAQ